MSDSAIQLIERFGSFGLLALLLVFGFRWAGRRVDRMLDHNQKLVEQFTLAVKAFQKFEAEQDARHERVVGHLVLLQEIIKQPGSPISNP